MFDKKILVKKIKDVGITQEALANEIGINPSTLFRKMAGETEFSRGEIVIMKNILKLSIKEVETIFFTS